MAARRRSIRSSSQGELRVFSQMREIDSRGGFFKIKKPPTVSNNVKPSVQQQPPRKNPPTVSNNVKPSVQQQPPRKNPPTVSNNVTPSVQQQPPRRVTWTLGLSEKDDLESNKKKVDEGFCGFLKVCSLCKKKLKENEDIYMYGYLGAFCSSECRDDQIALDGFDEEVSKEQAKIAMDGMLAIKDRQAFGTRRFK